MDGNDLFRRLIVGAKFNLKRFHADAAKLKVFQGQRHKQSEKVNEPSQDLWETSSSLKRKKNDADIESPEPEEESGSEKSEDNISEEEVASEGGNMCINETPALRLLGSIQSEKQEVNIPKKKKKKKKMTESKLADLKQEKINQLRNKHRIHTYGSDVPDPIATFDELASWDVQDQIVDNVSRVGFSIPTPIQMQAIPAMLNRRELLACAPTGSGKTAAFIIPILHHLKMPRNMGFRAVVLSPTRELAQQTSREFNRLAEGTGLRIFLIENTNTAEKKFGPKSSKKFDILVTTPNRLVYLLNQEPPGISLSSVQWLVVDESDKLFEDGKRGFRDQLARVYQACDSDHVRRAMFSATFASEVEEWCKLNLDNVLQVYIGAKNSATNTVEQELIYVGSESGKLIALRDIIRKGLSPPVLIFVQSKERAKDLFHEMIYDGINVDVIHSDKTQKQRDNIVAGLRSGHIWMLICTELMGRGMDFKGVNLVVNYDFPSSAISYIHRIGRTGRAGRRGRAVTFFTEGDSVNLRRDIKKKLLQHPLERDSIRTMPEAFSQTGYHRKFDPHKGKSKSKKFAGPYQPKKGKRDGVKTNVEKDYHGHKIEVDVSVKQNKETVENEAELNNKRKNNSKHNLTKRKKMKKTFK